MQDTWGNWHSAALALIVVLLPTLNWWLLGSNLHLLAWLVTMLLVTLAFAVAGHGVLGLWRGVLIDTSNCISLSRFQMTLWTILILSAFFTAALWNVHKQFADPMQIIVPQTVWVLMGISTTSLVGAPLIVNNKKNWVPTAQETSLMRLELRKQGETEIHNRGLIVANRDPRQAKWSDLFTGEEVGNAAYMDLARLQMLFLTLIIVLAYGIQIGRAFLDLSGRFDGFEEFAPSMLSLIGISHGGYLVSKGINHTERTRRTAGDDDAGGSEPALTDDGGEHDADGCHIAGGPETPDHELPPARGGVG